MYMSVIQLSSAHVPWSNEMILVLALQLLLDFMHSNCRKVDGWFLKPYINQTGLTTVVAPTDRPKSVRNRCVIKRFVASLYNFMHCL